MEAASIALGIRSAIPGRGNRRIAADRRQTGHEQPGPDLRRNRLANLLAHSSARNTSRSTAPARISRSDGACSTRLDQPESNIAPDQCVQRIKRLPELAARGSRRGSA